jgi:hypothetical protein
VPPSGSSHSLLSIKLPRTLFFHWFGTKAQDVPVSFSRPDTGQGGQGAVVVLLVVVVQLVLRVSPGVEAQLEAG